MLTGKSATTSDSTMTGQRGSLTASDGEFVAQAAQAGIFEVQSSRLALQKDVSSTHREFAQMMIDDHTKANDKLAAIVRSKGGSVPSDLDRTKQETLDTLRKLQGNEFERRYHAEQVKGHDEAIQLFERASKNCDDAELREFANDTLPTLRKHRGHLDQS